MAHLPSMSQFRKAGWQRIDGVIPPDVVAMLHGFLAAEVDRLLERLRGHGVAGDVGTAAEDIVALLRSPAAGTIDRDSRALMTGHFPTRLRLSETLWEIPRTRALQDILKAALGSDRLRMHMPPMARYVLPGNSEAGVPAHQDASYNDHMEDFVTVWIPLVPVDETCGGVTVFDGRKDGFIPVTKRVNNGVWTEGVPVDGLVPVHCVPMAPGDILMFNPYVIHASMPNRSDRIRFSMDCRFFGSDVASSKHYLDMTTWSVVVPELVEP